MFFKVFMYILFLYWIYIKSMIISHYGFVDDYYSYSQMFFKVFMNILFLNWIQKKSMIISHYGFARKYFPSDKYYSYSYSLVWNSWTIPIPLRTEVGSTNLFLFLFAGKITIPWSQYQTSVFETVLQYTWYRTRWR